MLVEHPVGGIKANTALGLMSLHHPVLPCSQRDVSVVITQSGASSHETTGDPTLPKYWEYFRKLPELFNYPILRKLKHWRDDVSVGAPRGKRFRIEICTFRPQSDARAHLTAIYAPPGHGVHPVAERVAQVSSSSLLTSPLHDISLNSVSSPTCPSCARRAQAHTLPQEAQRNTRGKADRLGDEGGGQRSHGKSLATVAGTKQVGIEHTRLELYIIMASLYPPAGVSRRQEAPGVDSRAVWTRSAPARQSFQSGGRRSELFRSFRIIHLKLLVE